MNGLQMKFYGDVERGPRDWQGGIDYILVAIRILSWILDHFPG